MFKQSKLGVYSPEPLDPDNFSGIREALDNTGVCVIQNILSGPEQEHFLQSFWDAIEQRKKVISRHDSSTWSAENTDWHGTYGAGQYKHYGMAQEVHCWIIRRNAKIRRIFEHGVFASPVLMKSTDDKEREQTKEEIFLPEDCCVSLDGCAAMFRPAVSGLKMHVDQVPGLPGSDFGSVQGAYNLYSVETNADGSRATAGFVCVLESHKLYNDMWTARQQNESFQMPKKQRHILEEDSPLQNQGVLVTSPPNSLVLWRSDLLHKNYGGDFDTTELTTTSPTTSTIPPPRLPRLTQFVTYMPKKFRTEQVLRNKIRSVQDGCSNNHWAALSVREPIVPFPAWAAKAKAIPRKIPTFNQPPVVGREEVEENAEEEETRTRKKRRIEKGSVSSGCGLPNYILDIL